MTAISSGASPDARSQTSDLADGLDRVLTAVDYLRVTVGPDDRGSWLSCRSLVEDSAVLASTIASTMDERSTDRVDVAMSLFVQGYAFRISSVAIGIWLLNDSMIDVSPELVSIRLGRGRPNEIQLADLLTVGGGSSAEALHATIVDGHLAPFLATVRSTTRIGNRLLWSNVGAAFASAFGAFEPSYPGGRVELRDRFKSFLAAGRPEISAAGEAVPLGPAWAWERSACCLFYKTGSEIMCGGCPLLPPDEREARYERILAEVES